MPVKRTFRGREVLRTQRKGNDIEIEFRGDVPGADRRHLTVPFTVYEREVRKDFEPSRSGPASAR